MGIERVRASPFIDFKHKYYQTLHDIFAAGERLSIIETLEIFDETIKQFITEYECTFRKTKKRDGNGRI